MLSLKETRIAIIGAGPSGLTLAHFLKGLGFESVKFFEALDHVGGQSITYTTEGIPVEIGTVYLTEGYVLAKQIAEGVGCPAEILAEAMVLDDNGNPIEPKIPGTLTLARYVYHWLWWYFSGQMRAPKHKDNAEKFSKWLEGKGLKALSEGFAFSAGLTAQLYGPIDAINAHSGLNWMRPSLFYTARGKKTACIPKGFQNMWKNLLNSLAYSIEFNAKIDKVQPLENGNQVELLRDGKPIDQPFDHVFIACPLDYLEDHPLEKFGGNPLKRLEHPLTHVLKEHGKFEATEVYSAVWKARKEGWLMDKKTGQPASRFYVQPPIEKGKRGPLLTIRNYGESGQYAVGQLCSYAFVDKEDHLKENDNRLLRNRDQILHDMEHIIHLSEAEIVHDRLWRYNIRFSDEQILQGLPIIINESQGKQNVWYSGGALSHWNIDAITDNSLVLVKRFAKQMGLPLRTRLKIFRLADLIADF